MKWMGYVVMVMIFMCSAATADTLNVPTDFETIQAAIDAAVDGDIVLIADGVYSGPGNVNLDPLGKAISIRSAQDSPDKCIIDCDHENRAFTITKGETQETIIRGLTISNGKAPSSISDGGAIYCYQSGPTISDCIFRNCTAGEINFSSYQSVGNGGAIWIAKTQAAIERCHFINCKAGYSGGAVSLSNSTITITECEFRDNQCEVNGGAIQSSGSSINVEKSLFTNNDASLGYGGAILLSLTTAFIKENTFQSNNAIHGGAIYNSFSTSVIGGTLDDGNVFTGNSAGIGADLFTSETPEPVNARFNTFMSHQDSDYSFENRTNFDFTDCQFLLVPITQPVYVSSTGSDDNDGLSSETPFRTIHHAISRVRPSADNPITIYLDEGTYSPETSGEHFPLPMLSNLTISGAGPYKTILSANSTSLVFYLANEKAALIEGVSIQDGHGDAGGGVFAINSSFQMTNCEISHCIAGSGAGVKAINSSGLFKHVHITDNASSEGGNSACINSEDGSLIFIQSTLARNTSDLGAIIFTSNNSITMIGCLIEDNTNLSESMCGGAFHCHGSLHLADCQILDNYANCMSAIINHGDTTLENCLIAGNKNRLNNSFINLNQGETRIQHCTIADHSLENDFNTVVNITGTELLMRDTIIWNNAE